MRTSLSVTFALVAASTLLSACSIADPPVRTTPTPSQTKTTAPPSYPAASQEPTVRLTITSLAGNASEQSTRHLVCAGPSPVEGTDFSGANESCQLLAESPELLERETAKTDEQCEGTGSQIIADVLGEANGKPVRNSFRRDNTCNVETWDALEALLAPGE